MAGDVIIKKLTAHVQVLVSVYIQSLVADTVWYTAVTVSATLAMLIVYLIIQAADQLAALCIHAAEMAALFVTNSPPTADQKAAQWPQVAVVLAT